MKTGRGPVIRNLHRWKTLVCLRTVQKLLSHGTLSFPGSQADLKDKRVWSPVEARDAFANTVAALAARVAKEGNLVWDKDDGVCLDFVTATANLRNAIFGIPLQSRFDVKCKGRLAC